MSPRHQAARALAQQGVPVFPTRVGGKEPLPYSNGFRDATTDLNRIDAWWADADYNLAFCPEDAGLCVVDVDGEEGLRTFADLCIDNAFLADTRIVATPSGGQHVYFAGSLPPTAHKLGPKVDTRGRGSYVLVPPSVVDGKPYIVVEDRAPAPLPEWIEHACTTVAERKTAAGEFEIDSPERIAEGKRKIAIELKWNGEPQVGDGSDFRAYKLAAKLRDIGLSDQTIADMLEALWAPHFDREWIDTKVTNCEKYGQNERGAVHVATADEVHAKLLAYVAAPDPAPAAAEAPPARRFADSFNAIRDEPGEVVEWVWQDRLLAGRANLYTGDAGAGKTTLAENLAVVVGCGVPRYLGADVMRMPVLLLVGEDSKSQVRDNVRDIVAALGREDDPGLASIFIRSVLTDDPEGGHLLAKIEHGDIAWQPFAEQLAVFVAGLPERALIVIDPLAEFVQFDNLDPADCRAVAMRLCGMISRFGTGGHTVLVNDHPSKAALASGAHYAGSAQLKAAFALFATLLKGDWGGTDDSRQRELTLSVIKARYAAESDTRFYRTSSSPLFVADGAPGQTLPDFMLRVYGHISERLQCGLYTGREDNRSSDIKHSASDVAKALDMSLAEVKRAIRALLDKQWLVWKRGDGSNSKAGNYTPAHLGLGPVVPFGYGRVAGDPEGY